LTIRTTYLACQYSNERAFPIVVHPTRIDNGHRWVYGPYMQHPITRDNWAEAAKEVGLRLESIAVATGKSYSAVYRYQTGSRTPSDEWVREVAALIEKTREANR
jgi:hypothetical protein